MGKQARNALHQDHDKEAIDDLNNQLADALPATCRLLRVQQSDRTTQWYPIQSPASFWSLKEGCHLQPETLTLRTKVLLPPRANTEITSARWSWSILSLQPQELLLGMSRRAHDRIILYFAQRCTSFTFTLHRLLFCCMIDQSILLICDSFVRQNAFWPLFNRKLFVSHIIRSLLFKANTLHFFFRFRVVITPIFKSGDYVEYESTGKVISWTTSDSMSIPLYLEVWHLRYSY